MFPGEPGPYLSSVKSKGPVFTTSTQPEKEQAYSISSQLQGVQALMLTQAASESHESSARHPIRWK